MAMTKQEVSYMAAGCLTKKRVAAIATTYMAWIDAQVTSGTAIQALAAASHSSKNPATVLRNAAVWYAAFENDPPTASAISPATGTTSGGTAVTITGTNLTGTTGVTFGGTAATSVVVVSDTSVTCVTPAKTAGASTVVITTPAGSVTKTGFYTYA